MRKKLNLQVHSRKRRAVPEAYRTRTWSIAKCKQSNQHRVRSQQTNSQYSLSDVACSRQAPHQRSETSFVGSPSIFGAQRINLGREDNLLVLWIVRPSKEIAVVRGYSVTVEFEQRWEFCSFLLFWSTVHSRYERAECVDAVDHAFLPFLQQL